MKLKSHQHRHLYKYSTLTQLLTTLVISKMNDRPMYVNNNNSYTFGLLIKKKGLRNQLWCQLSTLRD